MSTGSYTQCQSWLWPLTPWPKINQVPSFIIHNLHVKFESDWEKTLVTVVSTRYYTQSAKVDLDLWPCDTKSIGSLLSSSTTYMSWLKVIGQKLKSKSAKLTLSFDPVTQNQVKFESDWAKTVVAIVSKRYYTQRAKVDLDLWSRYPKSIGFLPSASTTDMWNLKVIGQNCSSYRVYKV